MAMKLFDLFRRKGDPNKEEANLYASTITKQLTRMGMCYIKQTKDIDLFQEVQFVNPLIVRPDRVELEVDVSRLPRGVALAQLKEQAIVETISTAAKRRVTVRHNPRAGFWFIVERDEIEKGFFYYRELQAPSVNSPLLIPIGRDERGKQIWRPLAKMPHLLLAGATGGGKTTFIHAMACWLVTHYPPDEMRLIMVDLKEGLDLVRYNGLPHLLRPVAHEREEALAILEWTFDEIKRRGEEMRELRASDIVSYRYRSKKRIPYITFIFDEIANLHLLDPKAKTRAWSLLKDSAQRARALGINLVFATQRPSVEVIDGDIKANFTTRVAFGCSNEVDSRVIIDDGSAANMPVGDLIYLDRAGLMGPLRGVYIKEAEVDQIVAETIAQYGDDEPPALPDTTSDRAELEQRMIEYARESLGGDFPINTLAQQFATEATVRQIQEIAQDLQDRGILHPARGSRPRTLAKDEQDG